MCFHVTRSDVHRQHDRHGRVLLLVLLLLTTPIHRCRGSGIGGGGGGGALLLLLLLLGLLGAEDGGVERPDPLGEPMDVVAVVVCGWWAGEGKGREWGGGGGIAFYTYTHMRTHRVPATATSQM